MQPTPLYGTATQANIDNRFSTRPRFLRRAFIILAFFGSTAAVPQSALAEEGPYSVVERLAEVLVRVEQEYVDPVERNRLVEGATAGMVAELDPHSTYLPPSQFAQFLEDTQGQFAGIGVEVDMRNDRITVVSTMPGSPAERAGLLPGDKLVAVDGVQLTAIRADTVIRRMRGAAGTRVQLTVRRDGRSEPFVVTVTRAIVNVPSVEGRLLDGEVAYVRLRAFQEGCYEELLSQIAHLAQNRKLSGLLLDLRSNPGGLVSEAIAIADEFLGNGTIYSARHRGKMIEVVTSSDGDLLESLPLVVLVNAGTASSAEIVAGALQDRQRATLVGEPTFGKGSVQNIIELDGGAGLLLTTLRYFTPNGHAIQARGLIPQFVVKTEGNGSRIREADIAGHLPTEGERTTPHSDATDNRVKPSEAATERALSTLEGTAVPTEPTEPLLPPERRPVASINANASKDQDTALAKGYELLRTQKANAR